MDKNTITGLILIAAVLIGFSWYNTNQERNLQQIPQTEQTASPNKQDAQTITAQQALNQKQLLTALTSFSLPHRVLPRKWC